MTGYKHILCYNLFNKNLFKHDYSSEEWEVETTCLAFDPNNEQHLYIGASDKIIRLVNFVDNFEIMKFTCFKEEI